MARAAVRQGLGVGESERMLVISGARHAVGEGLHSTAIFARLLGGPLPGVHVVVKLHPEEEEADHYSAMVEGLAAAGRFAAPPVTVVRDIDLFRLLLAADAHLGIYSTVVLTDAVVAGTPNMVAIGQGVVGPAGLRGRRGGPAGRVGGRRARVHARPAAGVAGGPSRLPA